jgi:hypothetical protein
MATVAVFGTKELLLLAQLEFSKAKLGLRKGNAGF